MKQRLSHISNAVARRMQRHIDDAASFYWHHEPFGSNMRASAEIYQKLWEEEKSNTYSESDALEKELGFAIDTDWFHDLALHTQIVIKDTPLCYQHGRVVYAALRHYLNRYKDSPVTIFETGTARGFSATCMAKALDDAGRPGTIMTFDVLPHRVKMMWNCIDDQNGPQTRADLLQTWAGLIEPYITFIEGCSRINLPKIQPGRVHFAFLDGAHGYKDVMQEFSLIVPLQKPGDVIVFDDYSTKVFPGLVQAVDEGCARFGYDKKVITANEQRAYVIARKKNA